MKLGTLKWFDFSHLMIITGKFHTYPSSNGFVSYEHDMGFLHHNVDQKIRNSVPHSYFFVIDFDINT